MNENISWIFISRSYLINIIKNVASLFEKEASTVTRAGQNWSGPGKVTGQNYLTMDATFTCGSLIEIGGGCIDQRDW